MFIFQRQKKRVELMAAVRRITDLTTPNLITLSGMGRAESRYSRALPALLIPCENGAPVPEESALVITKDLSDHGMGLVLAQPFDSQQAIVGLWLVTQPLETIEPDPDPILFSARVRNCIEIGGGYWQLGLELEEVITSGRLAASLRPYATRLLPESLRLDLQPVG